MEKYLVKINALLKGSLITEFTGFNITHAEHGKTEATVNLLPIFKRPDGRAHGGFLSYLADAMLGFASLTSVNEDQTVFTAEMKITFLEAAVGKDLIFKSFVLKSGKTMDFCECEIYGEKNGERYLTAKASGTIAKSIKR